MVPMPSDTCFSFGTRKEVGKALMSTIFISLPPVIPSGSDGLSSERASDLCAEQDPSLRRVALRQDDGS